MSLLLWDVFNTSSMCKFSLASLKSFSLLSLLLTFLIKISLVVSFKFWANFVLSALKLVLNLLLSWLLRWLLEVELVAPFVLLIKEEDEDNEELDAEDDNEVIEVFSKCAWFCLLALLAELDEALLCKAGTVVAITLRLVSKQVFLSVGVTIMSFELKRKNCVDGPRNCSIKFGFMALRLALCMCEQKQESNALWNSHQRDRAPTPLEVTRRTI